MPSPATLSLDAWLVAQSHEQTAGGYGERELARHANRLDRRVPKDVPEAGEPDEAPPGGSGGRGSGG